MSILKDSCCIICNKNVNDSSTISIRDYMRPLSNPELSLYSFFQLISNFKLLDISEVPQNACDKCYQEALHVLDFQTLCNKAVENIRTYSEVIEHIKIEHVSVGNDCNSDILYLPEENTEDGYDEVAIIPKNSDNVQDDDIASLPAPQYLPEEDTGDGYDVVEVLTTNSDNATDEDSASLPAPVRAKRKRNKRSHMSALANKKRQSERVECEHCHRLYRRDYMEKHKRIHTGKLPYKCKLCPKDFNDITSLKYHVRVHTDERPFKCEMCGNAFRSKHILEAHYIIHSDEKSFTCPECPKKFLRDRSLQEHMVTHAKVKPIECTLCGQRFTVAPSLRKHLINSCPGHRNNEASLK